MAIRSDFVVLVTVALLVSACSSSRSSSAPSTEVSRPRVEVALTSHGCTPVKLHAEPGLIEFDLSNRTDSSSSFQLLSGDHVVGQIERLESRQSATLVLDLHRGAYRTACQIGATAWPGGVDVGPPGASVALSQAPDLLGAAATLRSVLVAQADSLVSGLAALQAAVAGGDRAAAQLRYAAVRTSFGQLEPVADNFGDAEPAGQSNLAVAIDGPMDAGPSDAPQGLRLVEQGLWGSGPLAILEPTVATLMTEATALRTRVGAMHLDAVEFAGGTADELGQAVGAVAGDATSRPSSLEVIDLRAAADAARAVLGALRPALQRRDPDLESTVTARLAQLDAAIASAGSSQATPSGGLSPSATAAVVAASDALADAEAEIASVLDQPAAR